MRNIIVACIVFVALQSCSSEKAEPKVVSDCDSTISYSARIAPLVALNCNGCHFSGGSGNGDFTTYAGIKAKADNQSLKNRVVTLKDMPQAGSTTLTDVEIKAFKCWIEQGAPNN